jgi:hypothetical protein
MDKRGIEKIMTVWWFSVWVIIIIAVVVNVAIFTSRNIEYRKIDAEILADKVLLCINQEKINLFQDYEKGELIKECNFRSNVFEDGTHSFKIILYNDNKEIIKEIIEGSSNMFVQCDVEANAEHYPKCSQKKYLIKQLGKYYNIELTTASNLNGAREFAEKIK